MLSKTSNYVIARYICNFKHEGYHKVKCISKELEYRDNRGTRRHGDDSRSSLPLQEGTSTFGGVWLPQRPNQRHEGLTLFSDNPRHEGLGYPSNIGDSFAAGIGLYRVLGARIHNSIGGSQAITNTSNKYITLVTRTRVPRKP